jgi:hypothetical protein
MSLDFNGSNQYAHAAVGPFNGHGKTCAGVVRVDDFSWDGDTAVCFAASADTDNRYTLNTNGNNTLSFSDLASGSGAGVGSGALSSGTWYHFAFVRVGTEPNTSVLLYTKPVGSGSVTKNTGSGNYVNASGINQTTFGHRGGSSFSTPFDGRLAYVAVWDRVLSDGEINTLFAEGYNPQNLHPDDLLAFWPLDTDGSELINGADLTLVGSPTFTADDPYPLDPVATPPATVTAEVDGDELTLTATTHDSSNWGDVLLLENPPDITVTVGAGGDYEDTIPVTEIIENVEAVDETATLVLRLARAVPKRIVTPTRSLFNVTADIPASVFADDLGNANQADASKAVTNSSTRSLPIARFLNWPKQRISVPTRISVDALYSPRSASVGIDRIEFYEDDVLVETVQGDAWEFDSQFNLYTRGYTFDPADHPDGTAVEIKAIVYPIASYEHNKGEEFGAPRTLRLTVYPNSGGTMPNTGLEYHVDPATGLDDAGNDGSESEPFATPKYAADRAHSVNGTASGLTLRLWAGEHDPRIGNVVDKDPVILCRRAGVALGAVSLTIEGDAGNAHSASMVIWDGLHADLTTPVSGKAVLYCDQPGAQLVMKNCLIEGPGPGEEQADLFNVGTSLYFWRYDNTWDSVRPPIGYANRMIVGDSITNCDGDFLSRSKWARRCLAEEAVYDSEGLAHPDVYQLFHDGSSDDAIAENICIEFKALNIDAQGIFVDRAHDFDEGGGDKQTGTTAYNIAFINCIIQKSGPSAQGGGLNCCLDHALMLNCTIDQNFGVSGTESTTKLWDAGNFICIDGCYFLQFFNSTTQDDSTLATTYTFGRNHFELTNHADNWNPGQISDVTTDEPGFTDRAGGDYRPSLTSQLRGNSGTPPYPYDFAGNARTVGAWDVGALNAVTVTVAAAGARTARIDRIDRLDRPSMDQY